MTVPAGDWFWHPWRSRLVTHLARMPIPTAALVLEAQVLRRTDPVVARARRRITRRLRRWHTAGAEVEKLDVEETVQSGRVHVTHHRPGRSPLRVLARGHGGRPLTASQARVECERWAEAIDDDLGLDHHGTVGRRARLGGTALLVVDVLALFLVMARVVNLDWADPSPVAVIGAAVFSAIGAGVLARLATLLGDHLWAWRRSGPRGVAEAPVRSATTIALGGVLAVISVVTGVSVLLRIAADGALLDLGVLGPVLGALVGLAAATAPWLVVHERSGDGTEASRALAAVAPIVVWDERRRRVLRRRRARWVARGHRERVRARAIRWGAAHAVARRHRRADEALIRAAALRGLPAGGVDLSTDALRIVGGEFAGELEPLDALLDQMRERP